MRSCGRLVSVTSLHLDLAELMHSCKRLPVVIHSLCATAEVAGALAWIFSLCVVTGERWLTGGGSTAHSAAHIADHFEPTHTDDFDMLQHDFAPQRFARRAILEP